MRADKRSRCLARGYHPFMLCLLCIAGGVQADDQASSRPNVLLFFTDDQRASTIRALGNPQIRTPQLDKLAARGTAFTRAYIVSGAPGHPKVPVPRQKKKDMVPAGPFATQLYSDLAVDWIRAYQGDRPWFMYVALSAPHDPHEAPVSIRRLYDPAEIPLPPNFQTQHPFDNGDLQVRDEKLLPSPQDPQQIKN